MEPRVPFSRLELVPDTTLPTLIARDCPGNAGQCAPASPASTVTPALWNVQLPDSKGSSRVRIPLSPPNTDPRSRLDALNHMNAGGGRNLTSTAPSAGNVRLHAHASARASALTMRSLPAAAARRAALHVLDPRRGDGARAEAALSGRHGRETVARRLCAAHRGCGMNSAQLS